MAVCVCSMFYVVIIYQLYYYQKHNSSFIHYLDQTNPSTYTKNRFNVEYIANSIMFVCSGSLLEVNFRLKFFYFGNTLDDSIKWRMEMKYGILNWLFTPKITRKILLFYTQFKKYTKFQFITLVLVLFCIKDKGPMPTPQTFN